LEEHLVALKAEQSAHARKNTVQRQAIKELRAVGKLRFHAMKDQASQGWCSKDAICMSHDDEETARQIPNTTMQLTAQSCKGFRANCYGSYDMIRDTMHAYLYEQGCGNTDSNMMVDMLLLRAMRSKGEKCFVTVLDCCGVGNCALIDWFCVFLVDILGWFQVAGVVYFYDYHGKGPS